MIFLSRKHTDHHRRYDRNTVDQRPSFWRIEKYVDDIRDPALLEIRHRSINGIDAMEAEFEEGKSSAKSMNNDPNQTKKLKNK